MRGIGGPLLCIGDLLSDVGEENLTPLESISPSLSPSPSFSSPIGAARSQSADLPKLFQENYEQLKEALARGDNSWTTLTLKILNLSGTFLKLHYFLEVQATIAERLCSSLDMADKLVQSTNSNAKLLLEKVGDLEKVVRRGDSAVAAAKSINISLSSDAEGISITERQNTK